MKFHTATKLALIGAIIEILRPILYKFIDMSNVAIQEIYFNTQFISKICFFVFFVSLYRKQIAQSKQIDLPGEQ